VRSRTGLRAVQTGTRRCCLRRCRGYFAREGTEGIMPVFDWTERNTGRNTVPRDPNFRWLLARFALTVGAAGGGPGAGRLKIASSRRRGMVARPSSPRSATMGRRSASTPRVDPSSIYRRGGETQQAVILGNAAQIGVARAFLGAIGVVATKRRADPPHRRPRYYTGGSQVFLVCSRLKARRSSGVAVILAGKGGSPIRPKRISTPCGRSWSARNTIS